MTADSKQENIRPSLINVDGTLNLEATTDCVQAGAKLSKRT